jgi:AcrR family transcriptional regulator
LSTVPRSLDRASILDAALALVDRDGLAALNMRALARELDVGTMSLYHYVPSKDALLDGIVEALMAEIDMPSEEEGSWDVRATRMARSLRTVALRHPNCIPLMVTRPFGTADSLRPCNVAIGVLRESGLSMDETLVVFRTIVAFVLGYVMMESNGFFGGLGHGRDPEELLLAGLPRLAELLPHLEGRDIDADFDASLRIIELGALGAFATTRGR